MLVVGLTGGISTGKSTVSTILRAHNIPIIDADVLARKAVLPGTPALQKIAKHFGQDILLPDGSLDRQKLGSIVFSAEHQRKVLNEIVHPAVRRAMLWEVIRCWWRGERMCILDIPLLIESGLWRFVATVVVVYCSPEIQLQRLMARDRSSREAAMGRLNAQLPIGEKVDWADIVVDNSGSLQDLEGQIQSLIAKLHRKAGWSWRISWLFPPWGCLSALSVIMWKFIKGRRTTRKRTIRP